MCGSSSAENGTQVESGVIRFLKASLKIGGSVAPLAFQMKMR